MVLRVKCSACRFKFSGGKIGAEAKAISHALRLRHIVFIVKENGDIHDKIVPPLMSGGEEPPF